jgi:hypothetical protein
MPPRRALPSRAPQRSETALRGSSGKQNVVVILANPIDIHARAVAAEVGATFAGQPVILDTRDYPNGWDLTSTLDGASDWNWLLHFGKWKTRSDQVCGIWRRRIERHRIHSDIKDRQARRFCRNDVTAAFQGWLHSMGNAVINSLTAEYAASRKPLNC